MVGAACTTFSALVAGVEASVPSFTVQSIVLLVWLPPSVGSPPGVKT